MADCPDGYQRDAGETKYIVCKKGSDELVKVGTGSSAFWIDRYEASVWNAAGSQQYGAAADDYPAGLPKNGQATSAVAFAQSRKDVTPSMYLTWFQAQAACYESGKRLPLRGEWLMAAQGTPDPGANTGSQGQCVTQATVRRTTGQATVCRSRWGAEDMIGNLWEWTDEWYAGVGQVDVNATPWPQATADYGNDGTGNIASKAYPSGSPPIAGIPAAAIRGGDLAAGAKAGVFALDLDFAPSYGAQGFGFRCVVLR